MLQPQASPRDDRSPSGCLMTAFLQPSAARLWEAAGSQRAGGDAAPSRSARPDTPRLTGGRHPLTGTAPVPQPDPSAALPDGLPGGRHSSTVSTRSGPSSIPGREAEPSRAELSRAAPYRTQGCGIPRAAPPSCSRGGACRYAPPSRPRPPPAPRPTHIRGWICPQTTPTQPPAIKHF